MSLTAGDRFAGHSEVTGALGAGGRLTVQRCRPHPTRFRGPGGRETSYYRT